jgi:hypothetical protein
MKKEEWVSWKNKRFYLDEIRIEQDFQRAENFSSFLFHFFLLLTHAFRLLTPGSGKDMGCV